MTPALVLVMLLLSITAMPYAQWAGVVAVAFFSGLWILANGPMEGAVLLVVAPTHGLTAGDLVGLAGLAIAGGRGWVLWRARAEAAAASAAADEGADEAEPRRGSS
ncbi:hypothetical protein [Nocardioides bruguierae]|uniref:Uncharacterized protein n=1 Tax=Nocardioides bruguierae TaxID=2945102 RepID=A0A9X2IGB4_9ACTN|nr:hypothetical protein [Nocardioides bruguierae]MCM0621848.1 hypothetical protein [Nocardioides bruguierae]